MSTVLLNNLIFLETYQEQIDRLHPTITSKQMQILIKHILLKTQATRKTSFWNDKNINEQTTTTKNVDSQCWWEIIPRYFCDTIKLLFGETPLLKCRNMHIAHEVNRVVLFHRKQ